MAKLAAQAEVMSVSNLPQEKFDALKVYIDSLDEKKGSLIHVLHRAQHIFGFLPREVQLYVARQLGVSGAEVFGVVSFYSYFTTKPSGKYTMSVCMGTACFVRGADKVLTRFKETLQVETGGTTADGLFTMKDVRCIGACGLAPIVTVGEKVYGKVGVDDVVRIINDFKGEA